MRVDLLQLKELDQIPLERYSIVRLVFTVLPCITNIGERASTNHALVGLPIDGLLIQERNASPPVFFRLSTASWVRFFGVKAMNDPGNYGSITIETGMNVASTLPQSAEDECQRDCMLSTFTNRRAKEAWRDLSPVSSEVLTQKERMM